MVEYLPILIMGAVIGLFSLVFICVWQVIRRKVHQGYDRHMKDSELIRRLLVYARPYWKSFVLALVIMLFSILYDLIAPLIMGHVEETVVGEFSLPYLFSIVGIYGVILVISMVCTYLQAMLLQKTGQKILSALRMDLFRHVESLSHEQLNNTPVGKLVTRVTNDTNAISYLFTNILVTLVKNVMVIIAVLVAMLLLNYALTLTVLCFVPFVALFTVLFRKLSRLAHRKVSDATTDINTYLSENLSGIKITQSFNREERKLEEFKLRCDGLKKAKFGRMFVFGTFRPLVYLLNITAVMCMLFFSAKGYIQQIDYFGQTITSSVVVSFYMYISRFFNPIGVLAEQFDMLQKSFASAEKIFTVMDMVPQVVDDPGAEPVEEIRGDIEFKDVWFAYKKDQWILKGVSFKVNAGQTVAFVGATGSGKTTILNLICRNYDIQKGQILIDGRDIRTIQIASLRRHFGQMLQDVFLFSGTIRSNLLLGKEDVTEEELLRAIRYVNAEGFISRLERGLEEPVRERGNNFSAGQRQLLSFARTILHTPSVMILDEATANIDTETELLIQDSLEKMKNIGTMLVVAHRLSTIQHADNIILLSHGQIKEQGTHNELLKLRGRYYQLYTLQHQKEQLNKG